jgi:hypothetical protein
MPSVGAHIGCAVALGGGVFATVEGGYQTGVDLDTGDSPAFLEHPGLAVGLVLQL